MDILFQGSVAKYFDCQEDNEDAFNVTASCDRIVVCDGASESYDGKNWARLLTEKFSHVPPSEEALNACIEAFVALHDPASMSWSKAAAYDRGSFATALIAQDDPASLTVTVQCIGDSFAVLSDGTQLLRQLPYEHSAAFEGKPTLLSTQPHHNTHLYPSGEFAFPVEHWSYEASRPLFLLCMTDALGAWLLKSTEEGNALALERLLAVRTEAALGELVELERAEGHMRRDDSTLVIAQLQSSRLTCLTRR